MAMHQQAINIPNTSLPSSSASAGNGDNYLVSTLYEAAIMGEWDAADSIFAKRKDLVGSRLNKNLETALHVVATTKETKVTINFVKNLVDLMTTDMLELKNNHSNTAFWEATASGKTEIAKIMMKKNPSLMEIRGKHEYLPLSIGAKSGSYHIVKYLYENCQKMSGNHWTDTDRDLTLLGCVENDMYDLALKIVKDRPELARNVSVLEVLARKPEAFKQYKRNFISRTNIPLSLLQIVWGHAMRTMNIDEIEDMLRGPSTSLGDGTEQYSSRILFVATERGNTEFVVELLRDIPDLMLTKNDNGLTIFHIAVMHCHHDIYNLLYEIGDDYKNDIFISHDNEGNNMLHLVGKTIRNMADKMYGTMRMQGEFQWFQEVELMMPSYLREAKNNVGQTPTDLFSKESEYLVTKGLKLMKDCMIIAALIITVTFVMGFTIPGGYNQADGVPIFGHKLAFIIFVLANATSFFTASISLIWFLFVLTSSDNRLAFIHKLSRTLLSSLPLLVTSVAAMIASFCASLFVLYGIGLLSVLVSLYAMMPVLIFVPLHYHNFVDMLRDTSGSRFQPEKPMLYATKPRYLTALLDGDFHIKASLQR